MMVSSRLFQLLAAIGLSSALLVAVVHRSVSWVGPSNGRLLGHDFGAVNQNLKLIEHTLSIWNFSPFSLRIDSIKADCNCTVADFVTPHTVRPMSRVRIPVQIDISLKSGPLEQSVALRLAGGRQYKTTLRAYVVDDAPDTIDFGRIYKGTRISKVLHVRSYSPGGLQIDRIEKPDFLESASFDASTTSREKEILLTLSPTLGYGAFSAFLIVHTNDTVSPEKRIELEGEVLSPVDVLPRDLILKRDGSATIALNHFSIEARYGNSIEDLEINPSDPNRVSWRRVDSPTPTTHKFTVELEVSGLDQSIYSSELEVKGTSDSIPFRYRIGLYFSPNTP